MHPKSGKWARCLLHFGLLAFLSLLWYLCHLILNTLTVIILVSKSIQLTSVGGSYKSKNLESTPIKYGKGACKTSAKPKNTNHFNNYI